MIMFDRIAELADQGLSPARQFMAFKDKFAAEINRYDSEDDLFLNASLETCISLLTMMIVITAMDLSSDDKPELEDVLEIQKYAVVIDGRVHKEIPSYSIYRKQYAKILKGQLKNIDEMISRLEE